MHRLIILFTLLLLNSSLTSQIQQRENILHGTGTSLTMRVLDINGDGKPDLSGSVKVVLKPISTKEISGLQPVRFLISRWMKRHCKPEISLLSIMMET
jgi:hypothetical protein